MKGIKDLITKVIKKKKKQINASLDEYLDEADYVTTERLEILRLMAENECLLCDEILEEIKKELGKLND